MEEIWYGRPLQLSIQAAHTKFLNSDGSPYAVSEKQFAIMQGKIVVNPDKSTGTLTVGGFFCPTKDLDNCKSEFTIAGFQLLYEHNFVTKLQLIS